MVVLDPPIRTEEEITPEIVLERAEAWICEHGWAQRTFENQRSGAVCLVGAIRRGVGLDPSTSFIDLIGTSKYSSYLEAVGAVREFVGGDVVIWNDHFCSSETEALEAINEARRNLQCQ